MLLDLGARFTKRLMLGRSENVRIHPSWLFWKLAIHFLARNVLDNLPGPAPQSRLTGEFTMPLHDLPTHFHD